MRALVVLGLISAAASSPNTGFEYRLYHQIPSTVHSVATRYTHDLAHDLELAFDGIWRFARKDQNRRMKRGIYCTSDANHGTTQQPVDAPLGGNVSSMASSYRQTSSSKSTSTIRSRTSTSTTLTSAAKSATFTTSSTIPTPSSTSPWKLHAQFAGNTFFNGWDFWDAADPTHGTVDYVSHQDAYANNLIEVTSRGTVIMRVETTPQVSGYRKSIRITTQEAYDGALVILDLTHIPSGCGTWPAFWSNGPNWPYNGEIDIIEGVNDQGSSRNQATIHTGPGCSLPSGSTADSLGITGSSPLLTDCNALTTGNQGCGIVSSEPNSFGKAFNDNGGGVYAMQWDNNGIKVFFFPRDSIPSDINAGSPNPPGWGRPTAFWPATNCNPFQAFKQHTFIFDTSLCGDWAGSVWGNSCAGSTGVSSCEQYVQNNGGAFSQAYWEINSLKFYK